MLTQEKTLQHLLPLFIVRPQSFHLLLWHRTRLHSVMYFRGRKYTQVCTVQKKKRINPSLIEAGATIK